MPGGEDEQVGGGQQVRHVVPGAEEVDDTGEPQVRGEGLELGAQRPVADQQEVDVGAYVVHLASGGQQRAVVLGRPEVGHRHDERSIGCDPQLGAHLGARPGRAAGTGDDPVHQEPRGGPQPPRVGVGDRRRHREPATVAAVRRGVDQAGRTGVGLPHVVLGVDRRGRPPGHRGRHDPGHRGQHRRVHVHHVVPALHQQPTQSPGPPQQLEPRPRPAQPVDRDSLLGERGDEVVLVGQQVADLVAEAVVVGDPGGRDEQLLGAAPAEPLDGPQHAGTPTCRHADAPSARASRTRRTRSACSARSPSRPATVRTSSSVVRGASGTLMTAGASRSVSGRSARARRRTPAAGGTAGRSSAGCPHPRRPARPSAAGRRGRSARRRPRG